MMTWCTAELVLRALWPVHAGRRCLADWLAAGDIVDALRTVRLERGA